MVTGDPGGLLRGGDPEKKGALVRYRRKMSENPAEIFPDLEFETLCAQGKDEV